MRVVGALRGLPHTPHHMHAHNALRTRTRTRTFRAQQAEENKKGGGGELAAHLRHPVIAVVHQRIAQQCVAAPEADTQVGVRQAMGTASPTPQGVDGRQREGGAGRFQGPLRLALPFCLGPPGSRDRLSVPAHGIECYQTGGRAG